MYKTLRYCLIALLLVAFRVESADAQVLASGLIRTSGDCVTSQMNGAQSVTITVAGTYTGTITFSYTPDGSNFFSLLMVNQTTGATATTTTSTGAFATSNLGMLTVRACATATVTGTATVTLTVGTAGGGGGGSSGGGGGGASTIADGADVAEGSTTDAEATAGGAGTVSAKLRLATDLLNQINSALAVGVNITNGSTTDTDDGTVAGNQSSVAMTIAVPYGYDGSNDVRVRAKGSTPGSSEVGLVTRPLAATDGTNTTPTMDAVARPGFQKITDGTNTAILDPCESSGATISYVPVAVTATSVIKAGTSAKKTYVCGLFLVGATAENFSIIEGTGSTCGTSTLAVIGGATAATGMNLAANGGFVLPANRSWAATTVNANDLCLIKAGGVQVSGVLKVAVQ